MLNRELFPKLLRKYLLNTKMKQRELANAVGVSESTVSCWVHGKSFPETDALNRIADVLECDTNDLLTNRSTPLHDAVKEMIEKEHQEREELMLLNYWRKASPSLKSAAIAVLRSSEEGVND